MKFKTKPSRKGAVSITLLISTIVLIISFLIILAVINQGTSQIKGKGAENVCRSSVAARAASVMGLGPEEVKVKIKTVPLFCKNTDVDVSGTKEEVMKEVADLMARCWWMFHEGRYADTIDPFIVGHNCFPCYTVTIDKIEDADKIEWEEFNDWLLSHNTSTTKLENNTVKKESIGYVEYLTNYERIPGFVSLRKIEEKQIYYILYSDVDEKIFKGEDAPNGIYFTQIDEIPIATFTLGPIPVKDMKCNII